MTLTTAQLRQKRLGRNVYCQDCVKRIAKGRVYGMGPQRAFLAMIAMVRNLERQAAEMLASCEEWRDIAWAGLPATREAVQEMERITGRFWTRRRSREPDHASLSAPLLEQERKEQGGGDTA